MAKNNFLKTMFGTGAQIRKLKKLKKEYLILDKKLLSGKITKKELDKYYKVKEELSMAAQKFSLRNGKLVLNDNNKGETMNNEAQSAQPVQQPMPQPAPQPVPVQQPVRQPVQQPMPQPALQPAPQPAQPTQQQIQQEMLRRQHIQKQQEMLRQQQLHQEALRQQEMFKQQEMLRQEAIARQHAAQQPQPGVMAFVIVQDMPELNISIAQDDIPRFTEKINIAMLEGTPFPFSPFVLNGRKIIAYRFGNE